MFTQNLMKDTKGYILGEKVSKTTLKIKMTTVI